MSYVLLERVRLPQCSDSIRVTREHPLQFFEGVHCSAYTVYRYSLRVQKLSDLESLFKKPRSAAQDALERAGHLFQNKAKLHSDMDYCEESDS